jgi:hypothetical protein
VLIQEKQIRGTPPLSIFQTCDPQNECRITNSELDSKTYIKHELRKDPATTNYSIAKRTQIKGQMYVCVCRRERVDKSCS